LTGVIVGCIIGVMVLIVIAVVIVKRYASVLLRVAK